MVDLNQETALRPSNGTLLESPRIDRLSAVIKTEVLELYRQTGNLYDASRSRGVEPRHLRWHIEHDEEFKARVDDIHREFVERSKGYMIQHMARPGNYMDRVTIARRFEPGVWGDQVKHTVEHNVTVTQQLAHNAQKVVDSTLEVEAIDAEGTSSKVNT